MQEQTLDGILEYFHNAVENKMPVSPHLWIEGALKLNILVAEIDDQLSMYENEMAIKQAQLVEEGISAAQAKIQRITTIDYKDYLQKKAKMECIILCIQCNALNRD